jgi:TrmH family RNA methyltransferase
MIITSSANPQIKAIRKLRDRKERAQTGLFLAEGLRICGEAVEIGWLMEQLVVAPQLLTSDFGHKLMETHRSRGGVVLEVSPEVFESFSGKDNPQGIAAVLRQRWLTLADVEPSGSDLWVALEAIADPGNLGTILRSSDAVAGQGLILLDHSTDPYDPAAVRGSMGAIFSQRLVRASLAEFAEWKRRQATALVGTSDKARQDYHAYRYPSPIVLLMGSERQGISQPYLELCDEVVAIPMAGRSDSLNLAVATGVVLYEIYNQNRETA